MIKNVSMYSIVPKSTNAVKNIVGIAKTQQQQLTQGVKEGIEKGRILSNCKRNTNSTIQTFKTLRGFLFGLLYLIKFCYK